MRVWYLSRMPAARLRRDCANAQPRQSFAARAHKVETFTKAQAKKIGI